MKWVRDWLQSLPVKVNVRGLMCQAPEKVRDGYQGPQCGTI